MSLHKHSKALLVGAFSFLLLFGCNSERTEKSLLPESSETKISYANCLRLSENDTTKTIKLINPKSKKVEHQYQINKKDLPIRSIACQSTTHLPYIKALKELESIKGIGHASSILDTSIQKLINTNEIQNLSDALGLDYEKVLMFNPDILLMYPFQLQDNLNYENDGIKVIFNTDYLENSPLGRAEWIKFFACLYNKETEALKYFKTIETEYKNIVAEIKKANNIPPKVFTGDNYKDNWYVPGGESYLAQLIKDAGGELVDQNESTGSDNIDEETAIAQAFAADIWIKVSTSKVDLNSISENYPLLKSSKIIEEGKIVSCNTSKADYFGQAALEPHVILKDLAKCFNPIIFPEHEFVYFKPINKE